MAQQIPDEILYDVRLLERHIRKGVITRDQVEKHRALNADMADQCDVLDLDVLVAAGRQGQAKR